MSAPEGGAKHHLVLLPSGSSTYFLSQSSIEWDFKLTPEHLEANVALQAKDLISNHPNLFLAAL